MNTNQQLSLYRHGQPDDEAILLLRHYEPLALEKDPRGFCVCTSEGKDSRLVGIDCAKTQHQLRLTFRPLRRSSSPNANNRDGSRLGTGTRETTVQWSSRTTKTSLSLMNFTNCLLCGKRNKQRKPVATVDTVTVM